MNKFLCMIALATVLSIVGLYSAFSLGYEKGYYVKEAELKECAEEVSSGCPNVTTYAVMLEKENARLNRVCKRKAQKSAD